MASIYRQWLYQRRQGRFESMVIGFAWLSGWLTVSPAGDRLPLLAAAIVAAAVGIAGGLILFLNSRNRKPTVTDGPAGEDLVELLNNSAPDAETALLLLASVIDVEADAELFDPSLLLAVEFIELCLDLELMTLVEYPA